MESRKMALMNPVENRVVDTAGEGEGRPNRESNNTGSPAWHSVMISAGMVGEREAQDGGDVCIYIYIYIYD